MMENFEVLELSFWTGAFWTVVFLQSSLVRASGNQDEPVQY